MKINKIAGVTVASLAVLSGVLLTNQAAVIRQLDDWRVLPRPPRFSELYFTDERQLPSVLRAGSLQKLAFTINNLEHRTTNYTYKISAVSAKNGAEHLLGEGALTLDHGHSQTANQTVTVPALDARLAMQVKIEYEGIPLGENLPRPQTQSIFFWARTEGSLGLNQRETHHAS